MTHTIAAPTSSNSAQAAQHVALLTAFYQAFAQGDGEAMAVCYAPNARFSDPVFTDLHGQAVGDMWRMLTSRAQDFKLEFSGIRADEHTGEAHWIATYTFSQTGRTVVNRIHSRFVFADGKIAQQQDGFDLWRWTQQALGLTGYVLGWSNMVQGKIRAQAAKGLQQYQRQQGR